MANPIHELKRAYWNFHSKRNRRNSAETAILEMQHSTDAVIQCLGICLDKTLHDKFTLDERAEFKKIEALRRRLAVSSEVIETIDYGAGEPDDPIEYENSKKGIIRKIAINRLAEHTSKGSPWSELIFALIREFNCEKSLELGTCLGISACYQSAAMKLTGSGKVVTLEGSPNFAMRAEAHLKDLGYDSYEIIVGRFSDTLDEALQSHGPFDFMFNDGHHDGTAMVDYFEQLLPFMSEHAVLLFDDIDNYQSMIDGWNTIRRHEKVLASVDMGPVGLCVLKNGELGSSHFKLSLT